MRITLTPNGGVPVVLGDDEAGYYIAGFRPDQERAAQVIARTRAEHAEPVARGNRATVIEFTVDRTHKTPADAAAFAMSHADELPNGGLVEIAQRQNSGVIKRIWYKDAVLSRIKCLSLTGKTTVFAYVIQAGAASTQKPT